MPRGLEHAEAERTDGQLETFLHGHMGKLSSGAGSDIDLRPRASRKLSVSGDKISMQMSFENVSDFDALGIRGLEVKINVPLRIDYHRLAPGSQQIGSVRETAQIKLFEVHSLG
jgi:hypothetical protein